jgi:hypothetical protein
VFRAAARALNAGGLRPNTEYEFLSPRAREAAGKYGVTSVSVLAVKCAG